MRNYLFRAQVKLTILYHSVVIIIFLGFYVCSIARSVCNTDSK